MSNLLNLIEIFAVALALHIVAMDEPERRGIDAVAQATAISGAVVEDVAEVAVAVGRSDLGPGHPMGGVPQLVDVCGNDGLGETWPPAARLELVGRCKERLARD